jgi:hypothetical protein
MYDPYGTRVSRPIFARSDSEAIFALLCSVDEDAPTALWRAPGRDSPMLGSRAARLLASAHGEDEGRRRNDFLTRGRIRVRNHVAREMQARFGLDCDDCGEGFKPARVSQKRCGVCIAAGKRKGG